MPALSHALNQTREMKVSTVTYVPNTTGITVLAHTDEGVRRFPSAKAILATYPGATAFNADVQANIDAVMQFVADAKAQLELAFLLRRDLFRSLHEAGFSDMSIATIIGGAMSECGVFQARTERRSTNPRS